MTSASRTQSGLAMAALGAIAFSGKAIIVKLGYRYGVDAVTLIMYRMLFALPLFMAMIWWVDHRATAQRVRFTRQDWLGIAGLGFSGYYLASFLDFWGLQYISASLERLILYLNPTLVLVLGWLLQRRRVTSRQLVAMLISYAGVLLVFGHEVSFEGGATILGALLVFASAVSYATYLFYSGQMVQRLGTLRLVGWATSFACLLCLLQFVLLRPLSAAKVVPEVLWLSIINAVFCTALPVLLVMKGVEQLGSSLAAQVGMIGPMSTILLGALILGEPFNAWVLAGTVLVLGGVLWVTRQPR